MARAKKQLESLLEKQLESLLEKQQKKE